MGFTVGGEFNQRPANTAAQQHAPAPQKPCPLLLLGFAGAGLPGGVRALLAQVF